MILRTEKIIKKYHNRTVVNEVSVQVQQGEIVGLLGPNGAGKTTSFYIIVGLIKPITGNVFLDDLDITNEPMYRRAQLGIGYLPQEASVFRKLSVEDNILAILEMTNMGKEERREKLEELIKQYDACFQSNANNNSAPGMPAKSLIPGKDEDDEDFVTYDEDVTITADMLRDDE